MYGPILVIVPSRGRPDNIKRLSDQFYKTTRYAETTLVVCVDDDDPKRNEYMDLDVQAEFEVGPRLRLGGTLNKYAEHYAKNWQVIAFMGDDHLPRTDGWDHMMYEALHESGKPYGIAYGNDLFQKQNLPTAVFMTSNIINTIGYMVPPGIVHLYLDNFWLELGRAINSLYYLGDVIIEHMHPQAGKGADDVLYAEVNSHQRFSEDRAKYEEYKNSGQFDKDVYKILALS